MTLNHFGTNYGKIYNFFFISISIFSLEKQTYLSGFKNFLIIYFNWHIGPSTSSIFKSYQYSALKAHGEPNINRSDLDSILLKGFGLGVTIFPIINLNFLQDLGFSFDVAYNNMPLGISNEDCKDFQPDYSFCGTQGSQGTRPIVQDRYHYNIGPIFRFFLIKQEQIPISLLFGTGIHKAYGIITSDGAKIFKLLNIPATSSELQSFYIRALLDIEIVLSGDDSNWPIFHFSIGVEYRRQSIDFNSATRNVIEHDWNFPIMFGIGF